MPRRIKYLTKPLLLEACRLADENNYNRQLDHREVRWRLPETVKCPVVFVMPHFHSGGVEREMHMRIFCQYAAEEGAYLIVDVPASFYDSLPEIVQEDE